MHRAPMSWLGIRTFFRHDCAGIALLLNLPPNFWHSLHIITALYLNSINLHVELWVFSRPVVVPRLVPARQHDRWFLDQIADVEDNEADGQSDRICEVEGALDAQLKEALDTADNAILKTTTHRHAHTHVPKETRKVRRNCQNVGDIRANVPALGEVVCSILSRREQVVHLVIPTTDDPIVAQQYSSNCRKEHLVR